MFLAQHHDCQQDDITIVSSTAWVKTPPVRIPAGLAAGRVRGPRDYGHFGGLELVDGGHSLPNVHFSAIQYHVISFHPILCHTMP